jgi:hypothetical protein
MQQALSAQKWKGLCITISSVLRVVWPEAWSEHERDQRIECEARHSLTMSPASGLRRSKMQITNLPISAIRDWLIHKYINVDL